ncbi:hypothetical protein FACS1894130_00850 [Spirochaetia bacterium]|nr:hypothetical protein FACS1894130_00850 [Spirochaetia bacterium]
MKQGALLVVPALGEGRGGGHLVRSAALVRDFRSAGREAWLFIPAPQGGEGSPLEAEILNVLGPLESGWILREEAELRRHSWLWIILDFFKTTPLEFGRWAALGPLIGIDEGGPVRDRFDFLLDLLPALPELSPANLTAPRLLPLPKNRREQPFVFRNLETSSGESGRPLNGSCGIRILISFGAEDPAALTVPAALALAPPADHPIPEGNLGPSFPVQITALFGGFNTNAAGGREALEQAGVLVQESIPNLKESLASYDLVITHFGVTAFEALHAGLAVILLSPGRYHEQLAEAGGFISAGTGQSGIRKLRGLIYEANDDGLAGINYRSLRDINLRSRDLAVRYCLQDAPTQTLGSLIGGFTPFIPSGCPVCGGENRQDDPVLARFSDRTYRRCKHCSLVYMLRLTPPPIEYETDYFFDFYQKQYGKTYLEDFPNLKKTGTLRIRSIRRLLGIGGGEFPRKPQGRGLMATQSTLLDIGCAYGPFLAAAREGGFSPVGIDPAEDAIRYVNEKLNIPAYRGFFPDPSRKELTAEQSFDAVTLWYVIEHFENPRTILTEIHRLLKVGGVLAFSTPSFSGISGRKSPLNFLEKSPADHWTVWDPRSIARVLDRFGFEVKKIALTGHHPERFPLIGKHFAGKRGPVYQAAAGLSRLFRWGDTFEVYAVKKTGAYHHGR